MAIKISNALSAASEKAVIHPTNRFRRPRLLYWTVNPPLHTLPVCSLQKNTFCGLGAVAVEVDSNQGGWDFFIGYFENLARFWSFKTTYCLLLHVISFCWDFLFSVKCTHPSVSLSLPFCMALNRAVDWKEARRGSGGFLESSSVRVGCTN